MKEKLARLTSIVLNPFLVSLAVIVTLAFEVADSALDVFKWASIAVLLSVLPVFAAVVILVRQRKLDGIFVNPREQRTRVYLLASLLAGFGLVVLFLLDAPGLMRATFSAGLASVVVFMVINLFWKISLHTAFLAGAVTVLTIVFGLACLWLVSLLLLMAWSRTTLKYHTVPQVAVGAVLPVAIVSLVFLGFGLI